jgi:hypothetical protein
LTSIKGDISLFTDLIQNFESSNLFLKTTHPDGRIEFNVPVKRIDQTNEYPVLNLEESDITITKHFANYNSRFIITSSYSIKQLIVDIKDLVENDITKAFNQISSTISYFFKNHESYKSSKLTQRIRKNCQRGEISSVTNHYPNSLDLTLLAHFSVADLTLLDDFQDIKTHFDQNKGTLCTLTLPHLIDQVKVTLRDTYVLSDPTKSSLDAIGAVYGIPKVEIPKEAFSNIASFADNNPVLFKNYAITDALICLVHGIELQAFSYEFLGLYKVPVTIPSLSKRLCIKFWKDYNIPNFQTFGNRHIGDIKNLTAKGLQSIGMVGEALPSFLASYRGGRNESFIYGVSKDE